MCYRTIPLCAIRRSTKPAKLLWTLGSNCGKPTSIGSTRSVLPRILFICISLVIFYLHAMMKLHLSQIISSKHIIIISLNKNFLHVCSGYFHFNVSFSYCASCCMCSIQKDPAKRLSSLDLLVSNNLYSFNFSDYQDSEVGMMANFSFAFPESPFHKKVWRQRHWSWYSGW